jgi:hypothetical protein
MKRINISLSEELSDKIERLAEKKEMSVAEIARRSLELYLQRFPEKPSGNTRLPTFNLGKSPKKDFKLEIYRKRLKDIAG